MISPIPLNPTHIISDEQALEARFATYEAYVPITEEEALDVGLAAVNFIWYGDPMDEPYKPLGVGVFGIIKALRENDEQLHGEQGALDEEQISRLEQVETVVDNAVEANAHYFPFGHRKKSRYYLDWDDTRMKQLANARSNDSLAKQDRVRRTDLTRHAISEQSGTKVKPGPVRHSRINPVES